MILNDSLVTLSSQQYLQAPPLFFIPMMLINSQYYLNTMNNNIKPLHEYLYSSNNQFSTTFLPPVYLSNDKESTTIKDTIFHEKKKNIDSDLILINCTFTFCSSMSPNEMKGGAIFINNPISLQLKDCTFRKNEARMSGGAIYAQNATLIDINNCLFAENECKRFGSVFLHEIDEIIIKNTNFTLNKVRSGSGAISIKKVEHKAVLTNVNFFENIGKITGTLYLEKGNIEINNCLFYYNHAEIGPSSIKFGLNATVLITDTVFADESHPTIILSSTSELNLKNCKFTHPLKESIKTRGGVFLYDNNTSFELVLEYKQVQLDPIDNDESIDNKKTIKDSSEDNKEDNKESDKESNKENKEDNKESKEDNKEVDKESDKENNKENKEDNKESKEDNKEVDKESKENSKINNNEVNKENNDESNKESNKKADGKDNDEHDPVIVKHGNNNQSYVIFPVQKNLTSKNSFSFFFLGIILVACLIIFWFYTSQKHSQKLDDQNISIFNHEDLDPNGNSAFAPANEKLSELNVNDLPNVKMESF